MKKFKFLALAFVFGTASIFATNDLPKNCLEKRNTSVKNLQFDTPIMQKAELAVNNFNKKNNIVAQVVKNNPTDIVGLANHQVNMNNKNFQLKQIRNYALIMPDIVGKE